MLIKFDLDPVDVSLTGFGSNVTGAVFTLTANDSGDSLAHRISIKNDSANDHSGKTVTLVGTDADGKAQTEVRQAPAGSATVESVKYFLTLATATPSATIGADTFDIGWVDEFASATIRLNWRYGGGQLWDVDISGTINLGVEFTLDDFDDKGTFEDQSAVDWTLSESGLAAETSDILTNVSNNYVAARVVAVSYSSGAEAQVRMVQGG